LSYDRARCGTEGFAPDSHATLVALTTNKLTVHQTKLHPLLHYILKLIKLSTTFFTCNKKHIISIKNSI
jgi:hypothetical protein